MGRYSGQCDAIRVGISGKVSGTVQAGAAMSLFGADGPDRDAAEHLPRAQRQVRTLETTLSEYSYRHRDRAAPPESGSINAGVGHDRTACRIRKGVPDPDRVRTAADSNRLVHVLIDGNSIVRFHQHSILRLYLVFVAVGHGCQCADGLELKPDIEQVSELCQYGRVVAQVRCDECVILRVPHDDE